VYPTETVTIKPQQYNYINVVAKPFQEGITGILVHDQTYADQLGICIVYVFVDMCPTICNIANYKKKSVVLSPDTSIGILQETPRDVMLS